MHNGRRHENPGSEKKESVLPVILIATVIITLHQFPDLQSPQGNVTRARRVHQW